MADEVLSAKGAILANLDDRLRTIEKFGCTNGQVRQERVHNISECIAEMKVDIKWLRNSYYVGLVLLIFIALMAGINVAGVLNLVPK